MAKSRRTPYVPRNISGDSQRLRNHVGMVLDPCNSVLGPTAYRGSDGFVTRFRNIIAAGTTTANPYYVSIFYPAYNGVFLSGYSAATSVVTPVYTTAGPGQPFLLSNADSQRVIGACTRINYLGSELNRQGILYRGVVPESAVAGSTINQLIALCQANERTPDHPLETKFIPSSIDEQYWDTGSVAPSEAGDRNVIVTVMFGGTTVDLNTYLEHTLICEWRPKFGSGLVVPTPNTGDVPSGLERVRSALSKLGDWWLSASHTAGQAIMTGAQMYKGTQRLVGAARLAIAAA
nr:hypothetical protein [Tolivirales sp.]